MNDPLILKSRLKAYHRRVASYRKLVYGLEAVELAFVIICFVMMGVVTKSNYLWFSGTVAFLDLFSFLLLQSRLHLWERPDPDEEPETWQDYIREYANADADAFCTPCRSFFYKKKSGIATEAQANPIVQWRIWKFFKFLLLLILWIRPRTLHQEYFSAPVNSSSCTRSGALDEAGLTYNPEGFFPKATYTSYQAGATYTFCVLGRTWAWPSANNFIRGYDRLQGEVLDCSSETVGGFVDLHDQCPDSFPDKTLGVDTPLIFLPNTTIPPMQELCPGNTAIPVCIVNGEPSTNCASATRFVPGRPKYICPYCLNYIRRLTGSTQFDLFYEDCEAFSESSNSYDWFCGFCPGWGYGWLGGEDISAFGFNIAFWGSTLYNLIIPLFEMFSWTVGVQYIKSIHSKEKSKL